MDDIRENTIIKCGIDGKMLKLVNGKYSLYYRCPDYEFSERGTGKNVCMNRLSFKDRDIIYSELENLNTAGRLVVGAKGKKMHLAYEIAEIDTDYIAVYVINTLKIKINEGGYQWA